MRMINLISSIISLFVLTTKLVGQAETYILDMAKTKRVAVLKKILHKGPVNSTKLFLGQFLC